jgi:hypothetical protein
VVLALLIESFWLGFIMPVFLPLYYAIKTVQYGMAVAMELPQKRSCISFTLFISIVCFGSF